jgi:hypothetical protein
MPQRGRLVPAITDPAEQGLEAAGPGDLARAPRWHAPAGPTELAAAWLPGA